MRIKIRTNSGEYRGFEMPVTSLVDALRRRLESMTDIEAVDIHLIYAGQELEDGRTLADYGLDAYNLSGIPTIYMQVSVPDKMPIFLASYADPTKRITEYVSRYSTLAQVVDLLHDHRLTGGVDPETCLYVCKRTTGTTISNFGLPFDANSTLSNVYSRVAEMLQNQGGYSKFRHLTFVPAYDGNVHIIVDKVEEPRVKTEMFPRPTLPKEATRPVEEKKEGMLVNLSNQVHIERVKQEMVVNEYPHPHRPSAYYPRMDE